MAGRYIGWMTGGLIIAGILISAIYAVEPNDKGVAVNNKMVDAAKATLEFLRAEERDGRASVEDIYRWSRRVVEAEHFSSEAVKGHTELMREYHNKSLARRRVGFVEGNAVHATEYYLAEAEGFGGK